MTILLRPAGTRLEGLGSRTAGPCTTSYSQPKQIASWRRAAPAGVQQRGRRLMLATPREPVPIIDTGFMEGRPEPNEVTPFVKNPPLPPASEGQTGTGTLRPEETWYPAKMKYRTRDDNLEFWQEKFQRNIDIPGMCSRLGAELEPLRWRYEQPTWAPTVAARNPTPPLLCTSPLPLCPFAPTTSAIEKRWTLFSTVWWLVMQLKYLAIPPALRFLAHVAWRGLRQKAYEAHKSVVIYREC